LGHAIQAIYAIYKEFSQGLCCKWMLQGYKMRELGESVNYNPDCISAIAWWEAFYKIH